ncbi:hypothetical protein GQX74_008043 [Glossina fuscipes]|nr:hypothetical protein GQX74_008043 [Glossina fuscipes]
MARIRPRRRSGSSIVVIDGDDLKPCLPDDYISGQHYRQPSDDSKEIDQEMLTMLSLNQDNGPHREMAVDCPDNFIARNKTPPRYPPPRPPQLQSIKMSSNVVVKSPKVIANANPNGGLTTPTEDLELMVDGLYRKNSSSHSSSFGSEILSKKQSPESYDSISYQNLQHNNNELNSGIEEAGGSKKNSLSSSTSLPNSSNSSPTSSNSTNSAVTKNLFNQAVANTMVCGVGVAGIDSLTSLNSSSSTPPPEYELREFTHKQLTGNILPAYRKHRELPVDAPDSFIEIIKTTPRYPPPAHLSSLTSQLSSCSSTSTANTTLTRFNSNKNTSQRHHHHLQQQQQQETSLISTMSLNGSFEDYQQQQQQQFHHLANGKQQPQPQVAVMNGLIKSSNKHNEETTYLESTHAYLASHSLNGSIKPIPPPRDLPPPRNDSKALDGRLVINRNSSTIPPQLPDRKLNNNNINNVTGHGHHGQQIAQIVEPTLEQLDSIKKYQADNGNVNKYDSKLNGGSNMIAGK